MTQRSSIFENGRLKPGVYKIQNLFSDTYLDIHHRSMQLCCRPARDLEEGRGLWEIKRLGAGYTVQKFEPGKPEQYCSPTEGIGSGAPLYASPYPVAWRVELMDEGIHSGFEYVRFYWGPKKIQTWDLHLGHKDDGTAVNIFNDLPNNLWQTWRLIPVNVEHMFTPAQSPSAMLSSGSLPQDETPAPAPPYDGKQRCACSHKSVETSDDGFGTTVTEVTVKTTTNTTTTRKKYRVEE